MDGEIVASYVYLFLRFCIFGVVYLYLYLIMMRMHLWWNSDIVSFPERNTNSLEHQMSPGLARPCHRVKHSNYKYRNTQKERKTCSDNTNTEMQHKEIKTCSGNTCHHDLQGNVSETSRLLFRFNVCWWCCCLCEKRSCFKTMISIPVPSSFLLAARMPQVLQLSHFSSGKE